MSHAEKCPVCDGSGCIDDHIVNDMDPCIIVDCHGCDGKGWVEVGSDSVVIPVQPWSPCEPTVTIGPWVYESGIYSANVEVLIKGF